MHYTQRILALSLLVIGQSVFAEPPVDFVRDVQPILARKCFACHGRDADHREADLRLDVRDAAVASQAIVPGNAATSEMIVRILSEDPDLKMPPPDTGDALTDLQKKTLQRWIRSGAEYREHWAFVPPQQIEPGQDVDDTWSRNTIDRFVYARLKTESLAPSAEADPYTLVRRVYLDLIGLPPTPQQADAFVNSTSPNAYSELVDELLKSKHYGERWARLWLDLARYADTNGYEKDRHRSIWPYRDWVINALNDDMPFDQFSIEQLAGDMLPEATNSQRVATGFHRNTMLNEEGGIDPLEYRFHAMVDRVATTGTVWMGLTTGCAQCHTHKYDPITHSDYYSFMALMNNADEPDLSVTNQDVAARRAKLEQQIANLEAALPAQFPVPQARKIAPGVQGASTENTDATQAFQTAFDAWYSANRQTAIQWNIIRPTVLKTNLSKLTVQPDGSIFSTGDVTKRDVFNLTFARPVLKGQPKDPSASRTQITGLRIEAMPDERLPAGGPGRAYYEGRKGDFFLSELKAKVGKQPVVFKTSTASKANKFVPNAVFDGVGSSGWSLSGSGQSSQLIIDFETPVSFDDVLDVEMLFERHYVASLGRFRVSYTSDESPTSGTSLPPEIGFLLTSPQTDARRQQLTQYFARTTAALAAARKPIDALRKKLPKPAETLVLQERALDNLRKTHRHHRGEYLSPKEMVQPAIPTIFKSSISDPAALPTNRLQLANWLVSADNPLAGRVTVNRAWRAFFGAGIVQTSGDFGTQSEPPSHPKLLDWLAVDFIKHGQSLKRLHRLIVTSATYRQRSHVTPGLLERDPENRLLARGPRLRMDAEMVRDTMLSASGLRSDKMFGPSVYPPQPQTVTALAYGRTAWKASEGEDRYRRSLYTYTKRTAAFAAYTVFDAPTGENCVARRNRSNTPLQALTLLNDDMFLEMAQAAAKSLPPSADGTDPKTLATQLFRRFITRPPSAAEVAAILEFRDVQLQRLKDGELQAEALTGDKPASTDATATDAAMLAEAAARESAAQETAAWVLVARAIMNLDETITKQ